MYINVHTPINRKQKITIPKPCIPLEPMSPQTLNSKPNATNHRQSSIE